MTDGGAGESVADQVGQSPGRWNDVIAKTLFEIMIVAVGVLLALAVDEWRDEAAQKQLADEARTTLREEIRSNRDAVFVRMRRLAQLYALSNAHPDRIGDYVFERRNMALLINDSAWTMAIETGALRWLTAKERASVAAIYAGQTRMRDVVNQEMTSWAQLAAFRPDGTAQPDAARDRALRIWQAFAQRAQLAQCSSAGRYERALGANIPDAELVEFCRLRRTEEDPAVLYDEWAKRGWTSTAQPRLFRQHAPR